MKLTLEHTWLHPHNTIFSSFQTVGPGTRSLRAGVCRPCDTIELTATSCNVDASRKFALISNF